MQESRAASRYAKSLLQLAQEKNVLDSVVQDMNLFAKICEENRALVSTLKSPIIGRDKKQAILKKIFEGKINALTVSFFDIIVRKNREGELPQIAQEFKAQYRVLKGILSGEVVTPFPLTEDLKKQFKGIVAEAYGKDVELKEKVSQDIIGGFILKVGDKQIDESVKSKLQKIKNKFKDNSYVAKY